MKNFNKYPTVILTILLFSIILVVALAFIAYYGFTERGKIEFLEYSTLQLIGQYAVALAFSVVMIYSLFLIIYELKDITIDYWKNIKEELEEYLNERRLKDENNFYNNA